MSHALSSEYLQKVHPTERSTPTMKVSGVSGIGEVQLRRADDEENGIRSADVAPCDDPDICWVCRQDVYFAEYFDLIGFSVIESHD